jgi:hypothetical protein
MIDVLSVRLIRHIYPDDVDLELNVNGRELIDIAVAAGLPPVVTGVQDWVYPAARLLRTDHFFEGPDRWEDEREPWFDGSDTALLADGSGQPGSESLLADIRVDADSVRWSNFRWYHASRPERRLPVGPFVFYRAQYENALRKALRDLEHHLATAIEPLRDLDRHLATPVDVGRAAREALAIVQGDLNASGLGRLTMRFANAGTSSDPVIIAALPDGNFWGGSDITVDHLGTDIPSVLVTVAGSVQDTLAEVELIIWPRCAQHQDRQAVAKSSPDSKDGWPVWWCDGMGGHILARIGDLARLQNPPACPS